MYPIYVLICLAVLVAAGLGVASVVRRRPRD